MVGNQQFVPRHRGSVVQMPAALESMHLSRAEALERTGNLHAAAEHYQQALELNPACIAAWNNLGNVFASLKDWRTANLFLRRAELLHPTSASVKNNLANVLEQCGDPIESVTKYRAAIALEPANALFRNNLGNVLRALNDWPGAEEMFLSALTLRSDYAAAYCNLGYLRYEQGRFPEAEQLYRTAIAFDPGDALAHTFLAQLLLARGEFLEGTELYEWRWQWHDFPSPPRNFTHPQWHGESLEGKRILLHAEQGLGDTIHFARYAPLVAARGAHVILEVHPELVTLMHSLPGVHQVVARNQPLPWFDLHCPLLSLPHVFRTTLESIPAAVPYLHAHRKTHHAAKGTLNVGIVWAGNPSNRADCRRSIPFCELEDLLATPGVAFHSFQRGEAAANHDCFESTLPQTGDFAETAATLGNMDLLISVDTAMAHLAGALGLPVWILLPHVSDWRWLRDTTASPWYPTATLYRQSPSQDWFHVLNRVARDLGALAEAKAAHLTYSSIR